MGLSELAVEQSELALREPVARLVRCKPPILRQLGSNSKVRIFFSFVHVLSHFPLSGIGGRSVGRVGLDGSSSSPSS